MEGGYLACTGEAGDGNAQGIRLQKGKGCDVREAIVERMNQQAVNKSRSDQGVAVVEDD